MELICKWMIPNFPKVLEMVSVPSIHHRTAKSTKQRYSVETVSCGARRVPLAERKEILDTCVLIAHSNWHSLATYVNYHSIPSICYLSSYTYHTLTVICCTKGPCWWSSVGLNIAVICLTGGSCQRSSVYYHPLDNKRFMLAVISH